MEPLNNRELAFRDYFTEQFTKEVAPLWKKITELLAGEQPKEVPSQSLVYLYARDCIERIRLLNTEYTLDPFIFGLELDENFRVLQRSILCIAIKLNIIFKEPAKELYLLGKRLLTLMPDTETIFLTCGYMLQALQSDDRALHTEQVYAVDCLVTMMSTADTLETVEFYTLLNGIKQLRLPTELILEALEKLDPSASPHGMILGAYLCSMQGESALAEHIINDGAFTLKEKQEVQIFFAHSISPTL